MDRRAWWATVPGVARVRHSLVTKPPPRVKTERPSANRPSECHSRVYIIKEETWNSRINNAKLGAFSGGLVVKILPSNTEGMGLIPGQGAKTPHALWPKNKSRKSNKFNKDFKNGPHPKIIIIKKKNGKFRLMVE